MARTTSLCALSAAAGLLAGVGTGMPATADENHDPAKWNGHKIYLSPARHSDTGSRGECSGASENSLAHASAIAATYGRGYSLVERGYKVQVGTGTVSSAIANSNAWGANAHIPIHSNARAESCTNTNSGQHGTVVIYRTGSLGGQRLASHLESAIDSYSPGTSDATCYNPGHPCTTIDLGELRSTSAEGAYLEAEFHTWKSGTDWLARNDWQWLIGNAVDLHYGYPR